MKFKRIVSTVLSFTLMASLLNGFAIPAYASGDDVIAIEASRLPEENLVTDSVVYMGTSATNLNEADAAYAITVYRDGDVSGEASVEVKTHDLTAVYGKDYELCEDDVEVTGDGISILEKHSKQQAGEEDEEPFEDMPEPFAYRDFDSAEEKSSLALLKEAQTGEETRETYPTEFKGLSDSIMQSLAPELGNIMESSSSMILNFAPGETEKVIKFRILDDSDSEGSEGFTITLNNPEGTSVYGVTATAVTITDDEPTVHSTVSFSDSEYNAEDGKVEITVIREGALYSVSDVLFRTSGDSATAGENYIEQNSIIAFMPYETEKTVEMSVSGEGRFDVFLSEFKGCEEGEYTRATVNISNDGEFELFAEDTKSFNIVISDKTYSVEYEMNQPTGTIMDTGYDPALEVGTYYFSSDNGHGGIFKYSKDQYGGSKPWGCGVRESKYVYKSDSDMSQNYGSLKYYHTSTWKNGYTYTQSTSTIPGVYYQYIIPDWRETSSFGSAAGVNPQQSRFELFDGSTSIGKNSVMGSFSRSQNKGAVKLEKQNKDLTAKVYSVDDDGSKTPKSYVEFYGLAAMYKKYTISIETPAEKEYISGSGSFSAIPAQVKTASGAQVPYQEDNRDIYVNTNEDNSNIVFEITDGDINGVRDKFGTLTGYTIKIDPGTAEEKTELNYPADYLTFLDNGTHSGALDYTTDTVNKIKSRVKSDLRRIPVDKYFVDWIDSVQKKTVSSGHGYYQILKFKPVFDYNNVKVQVEASVGGSATFNNSNLTSGSTVTYHAGDSIDLSATAKSAGQHVAGYEVSTDGGVNFNLITDTSTLLLRPDTKYIIRPRVADNDNRIEIQLSEEAKKRLHINNLIDTAKLTGDLTGKYILNLNPNESDVEKMMAPEPGSVYNLQILVTQDKNSDYIYRPVIKTALDENTYKTQYFDFVAKSKMIDNIINLDVEKVKKSELTYFSLTGSVISDFKPIRTTGTATASFPVTGYNLFAGGEEEEFYDSKTENINKFINRVSASTDDNGKYRLEGIYAKSGDTITVLATNGSNSQICAVTLSSDGLTAEDISHAYNEPDKENKTNTMKTETVKGYVVAQERIKLAYPSNAPYVASIMYNYNKSENTAKVRLTDNTVRMFDDTLNITAVVNPMGRKISKAIFTAYTVTGKKTEFEASADENNPGIFIVSIEKMLDNLHNGDKIYVRLVDEECNTVSNTYYDEVLKEEVTTTNEIPIEYPDVDTGLMTYVENELIAPQTYEFTTTPTVNIPLIGNMKGNSSSGIISFKRTNWEGNTGYTLTLNLDGAYTTGKTLSTPDKLNKFKEFKNGVSEIESMRKEAVGLTEDAYNASCERLILEANNCDATFGAGEGDDLRAEAKRLEEEKKEVTKAMNNREAKNKDKAVAGFNHKAMSVDAIFMMMFEFVHDPVKNEYIFSCGSVCIGGTMSYAKVMYTTIYGIPVYLQIGGSLQVDFPVSYTTENGENALTSGDFNTYAGNIAERLSRDTTGGMEVMLSAKVQAGVGMCGVIGARGYINLSLQTAIIGDSDGLTKESGVLFSTTGGIGIDLLITSIDINLFSVLVGTGAYSDKTEYDFFGGLASAGSEGKIASYSASDEYEILSVKEDGTVVQKHDYFAGNDDMSSFGKNDGLALMGMPQMQNINVLFDNAAERTRPQLIDLGQEGKMLVFIGSDANADEYNKARLMYSVQNNGEWSTPKIVSDDDTVDSTPEVLKKDNKVYIAWSDASRKFTEEDSLKDKLITFGISTAVYDVGADTMGSEITLTHDGYFNLSPQLNVVDNKIYCNYMKRDLTNAENEEALLDMTDLYSTMAYRSYDFDTKTIGDEKYISIRHGELTDPLVFDYNEITTQAGEVFNNYMISTYTVDEDMNLMTDGDREVFLEIYNIDDDKRYYPIQLSDDYVSQSVPKLTDIDGNIILTWIEDGYLFKMMNVTDLINSLTDRNIGFTYINSDPDDVDWYKRTASELGMSYENYRDSTYSDLCSDNFYVYETNFKGNDEQRTVISSYKLVSDGDDLYVFYTDFGDEHTDLTGVELYGAKFKRYQENGSGEQKDQEWGWSDSVKITDSGKVIDEFDLFMDAEKHIHAVSNFYEQSIDANGKITYSPNQLVTIDFGIINSLDVENFDLSSSLIPGEKSEIVFDVANNGLLTANGFDVTVSAVKDGAETVIYTDSSEETIETGESAQLNILWTVPEDISDTKIKVVVREKDVDGGEIVFEEDVPNESKLEFTDNSVTWSESTPHFATTVTNTGSIASEAYECRVIKNDDSEKEYFTFTVDSLAPGETREYTQAFEIVPEDFNEKGIIPIKATAYKGEEAVAYTVTDIVVSEPVVAQINNGEEMLEMTYGEISQLSVAVAPWSEIAGDAVYYSSDVNVANVNQQGEVYATGNGSAKIRVLYPAENVYDEIEVSVSGASEPTIEPTETPTASRGGHSTSSSRVTATPNPTEMPEATETPEPTEKKLPFEDVAKDQWYYESILSVYENGLMSGIADTLFGPDMDITRGMFVTVLHRMEEEPAANTQYTFEDVDADAYYADAVVWAQQNGIVYGVTENEFAPDDNITREQIAAIMFRYAKYKGYDVSVGENTNILSYTDAESVSEYAIASVQYAVGAELMKGKSDTTLNPQDNATRAEIAAILQRFLEANK